MKTIAFATLALAGPLPLVVIIFFWLLLAFWLLGAFAWRAHPNWPQANSIVLIIEFAILGYAVFRFGN